MKRSQILTLGGATVALALAPTAALAAGGTTVNVRIEGKTSTLLAATNVKTHTGSITKGGTPAGTCPATTAAGALDVATHHNWAGSYGSLGLSVTSILGESHPFTSSYYWSVWVNNKFATAGVCGLKLHAGEQLLFAAVPDKGSTEYPIVLTGPGHATVNAPFKVKASYFNAKGVAKPLADVHLAGGSVNATTGKNGTASIDTTKSGALKLRASSQGFIRSATLSVSVAK
jgi:hypothetical protein